MVNARFPGPGGPVSGDAGRAQAPITESRSAVLVVNARLRRLGEPLLAGMGRALRVGLRAHAAYPEDEEPDGGAHENEPFNEHVLDTFALP